MHGAQRKHIFFAGVPKRTGHMSMRDQSALLTVAFSLSAASRCLQEQETDGARGDPPAGGRGSCTSRTCCARLGACAPLSEPPRLRVSKIGTLMGARLPLAGAVRRGRSIDEGAAVGPHVRRTLPLPPVLAPAAGHKQLWAAAAAAAVEVDAELFCRLCGARVWQHWKAPCARCAAALLLLPARRMYSVPRCACACPGCTVRTCVAPLVCPCVCTSVRIWQHLRA